MKHEGHWDIEISQAVAREIRGLRKPIQERIRSAIRTLADDPTPADSLAMRGKGIGFHRLRVGSYRIIYKIQSGRLCVLVIRVAHRSAVYQGFEER